MSQADSATYLATDQRGAPRKKANRWDIAFEVCGRTLARGLIEPTFCGETSFAGFPTSPLTIQAFHGAGGIVIPTPGTYNAVYRGATVCHAPCWLLLQDLVWQCHRPEQT